MGSENTLTGRRGKIEVNQKLLAKATEWSVNPTMATSSEWGDSGDYGDGQDEGAPEGYTWRAPGRLDASFDFEGKYAINSSSWQLFQPGDIAQVTLWLHSIQSLPFSQVPNKYWYFPRALCNDFSVTVDIDSEEVIGFESSWGADGIFYRPGESGQPADTLPSVAEVYTSGDRAGITAWEQTG